MKAVLWAVKISSLGFFNATSHRTLHFFTKGWNVGSLGSDVLVTSALHSFLPKTSGTTGRPSSRWHNMWLKNTFSLKSAVLRAAVSNVNAIISYFTAIRNTEQAYAFQIFSLFDDSSKSRVPAVFYTGLAVLVEFEIQQINPNFIALSFLSHMKTENTVSGMNAITLCSFLQHSGQ